MSSSASSTTSLGTSSILLSGAANSWERLKHWLHWTSSITSGNSSSSPSSSSSSSAFSSSSSSYSSSSSSSSFSSSFIHHLSSLYSGCIFDNVVELVYTHRLKDQSAGVSSAQSAQSSCTVSSNQNSLNKLLNIRDICCWSLSLFMQASTWATRAGLIASEITTRSTGCSARTVRGSYPARWTSFQK